MLYLELFLSFLMIGFTSFGGLSMIPLINEQMISHGWMTAKEVADIVAIAEMTPGPLGLNCATFAGIRTAGALGSLCASLGVLLPSFTVCMIAGAFLQKFKDSRLLGEALHGIRPVCIGMIAYVVISQCQANYFTDAGAVYLPSIGIGCVAMFVILKLKWDVPQTIILCAVLGLLFGGL